MTYSLDLECGKRKIISAKDLLSILNKELSKYEDYTDCRFTSITRIKEVDENGCNWSSVNLRCSGVSIEGGSIANRIIQEIKDSYNIKY